ncbi:MAG: polyphenol oxidase family protein [Actinomycetota bacterium]
MVSSNVIIVDRQEHGVHWGFTGRGNKADSYGCFNLGLHVGDDADAVNQNRSQLARLWGVLPAHLITMNQVHSNEVQQVDDSWSGELASCDALVTRRTDVALVVLVADCVPVVLMAPGAGVLGVAHAGRRGMAAGVVSQLAKAMFDLGARRLVGVVGPSICARCYEVPMGLYDEIRAQWPVAAAVSRHGSPALDIAAGVLHQLTQVSTSVEVIPGCTAERSDLYSYRRDGLTGRFAGVARLLPELSHGM